MAMKPDAFLCITLASGVCIIIIGLIIVLFCPLHALSCSWWHHQIGKIYRLILQRKNKETINSKNTIAASSFDIKSKEYGVSLVEGRPQGHGFYTAGPWTSSTDTTSTTLSTVENLAQLGLVGSEYYSVIMNSTNTATANNNTATTSDANPFSSIFPDSSSSNNASYLGQHGDNSSALMALSLGNQQVCMNCSGGFFPEPNTGVSPNFLPAQLQYTENPVGSDFHHLGESMYSVDGGDDTDADMIMMM